MPAATGKQELKTGVKPVVIVSEEVRSSEPELAQLDESREALPSATSASPWFTQSVAEPSKPALDTRLDALCVAHVQAPALHCRPGHARSHAPQFNGSPVVSMQRPSPHVVRPHTHSAWVALQE